MIADLVFRGECGCPNPLSDVATIAVIVLVAVVLAAPLIWMWVHR